jgi:c(7)-type cytochrome triheme protein
MTIKRLLILISLMVALPSVLYAVGMSGMGDMGSTGMVDQVSIQTKTVGKVIFSHNVHGTSCGACHPKIFEKKRSSTPVSMKAMERGKSCGACHDGKKAFTVTANCTTCHAGDLLYKEEDAGDVIFSHGAHTGMFGCDACHPDVLEVTEADEEKREVINFNGKPAAIAYAEAVGTSLEEASNQFMHNPIGLIVEDEPYVRSPQQILSNGTMKFYCSVSEGMELSLLESTNIIEDTRAAIKAAGDELGSISAIINFNCILRTLELKQKNLTDEYGKLFAEVPTIGFSTYGEQYIGHVNQTATMLVLK